MAISAVFRADFTDLVQEIKRTEVRFEEFKHKTEDVQESILKIANRFSGSKLISEAELMAGAIEKIGGVSRLTEREAARVGRTMAEAMEKAHRAGQEVSPAVRRIAEETQRATAQAQTFGEVFRGSFLGTALANLASRAMSQFWDATKAAIGGSIAMNAELERSTLQFATLMGNTQKAEAHVRALFKFAKDTPFETGPIITASRHLQLFGGDALNTTETLTKLGNAAAASGAQFDEVAFWTGRLYAALQGGQPIGEAAARLMELGVIAPDTRSRMEALAESAGGGSKAFDLFKASLSRFEGAMAAQANTWDGLTSSIRDSISILLADALHPMFETIKTGAQVVLQALGSDGMQRAFENLSETIRSSMGGGSTDAVKSFISTLLVFGQMTISVAQLTIKTFYSIESAVKLTLWAIVEFASGLNKILGAVVSAASAVPGLGRSLDGVKRSFADSTLVLDGMTSSLRKQTDEAVAGAMGYSGLGRSLDAAQATLGTLREEVFKATSAQTQQVTVTRTATESVRTHNKAVDSLVSTLSGAGAIQQVKNLEAAFKALTPEQRANERILHQVLVRYQAFREIVGTQVAPALERAFVATGTLEAKTLDLSLALHQLQPAVESTADEIERAGNLTSLTWQELREAKRETQEWAANTGGMLAPALQSMNVTLGETRTKSIDWRGSLDTIVRSLEQLATIGGSTFRGFVQWLGNVTGASKLAEDGGRLLKEAYEGLRDKSLKTGEGLAALAAGALTAMAAMDQATASGSTLERTIGGAMVGFQIGNTILPGFGGTVGLVAGGLFGLFRGLFSVSEETRKVRGEIASFEEGLRKNLTAQQGVEAAGRNWAATTIAVRDAYMLTGRSAAEAEAIVKQLWDDKNPNQARAAMEQINRVMEEAKRISEELNRELNGALGEAVELGMQLPDELSASIEQLIAMGRITGDNAALFGQLTAQTEPNFKKMEEAAKKYGVELGALGPAFAQNQLNERAKDIIDSFETMKRGGADVGGVIAGMSDEINQFVQDAISSGRQVPENMKPIIEAMMEQGRLTDANGTKLTDMSGINFGPPVESAFDKVIRKLQELIDKLSGGMGFDKATQQANDFAANATTAIRAIPSNIPITFEATGEDLNNDGDPGFATGTLGRTGSWFKNFGQGSLTVLHGDEAVVRRDQASSFAQAFGGGIGGTATVEELRALRSDLMAMPQHMARAVRDALLVAG